MTEPPPPSGGPAGSASRAGLDAIPSRLGTTHSHHTRSAGLPAVTPCSQVPSTPLSPHLSPHQWPLRATAPGLLLSLPSVSTSSLRSM